MNAAPIETTGHRFTGIVDTLVVIVETVTGENPSLAVTSATLPASAVGAARHEVTGVGVAANVGIVTGTEDPPPAGSANSVSLTVPFETTGLDAYLVIGTLVAIVAVAIGAPTTCHAFSFFSSAVIQAAECDITGFCNALGIIAAVPKIGPIAFHTGADALSGAIKSARSRLACTVGAYVVVDAARPFAPEAVFAGAFLCAAVIEATSSVFGLTVAAPGHAAGTGHAADASGSGSACGPSVAA